MPSLNISNEFKRLVFLINHPVNSFYFSDSNTNPGTFYGGNCGSWTQVTGYYLYMGTGGNVTSYTGTNTQSHTLTAAQSGLPWHGHGCDGAGTHNHELGMNDKTVSSGSSYARPRDRDSTTARGYLSTDSGWHAHGIQGNGNWNASEGHAHNIATRQVYAWKRTA